MPTNKFFPTKNKTRPRAEIKNVSRASFFHGGRASAFVRAIYLQYILLCLFYAASSFEERETVAKLSADPERQILGFEEAIEEIDARKLSSNDLG